jgi:thioredoxin-dependent peroxiredoxin
MGWTNSHLHQFQIKGEPYGDPELLDNGFDDFECEDSTTTMLNEFLPKTSLGVVEGVVIVMLRYTNNEHSGRTNVATFKVGDRAPDFSATTYDGNKICLADFLGKRAVVLFFYPRDGTPICTQEACSFRDSYDQFIDAGAEVIGVSGDTEESHRTFARQHKLSFPLISDADGSLRKAFAVPKTMGLLPGRVTYVIDQAGIIRQIFSAQFASDEHVRQALSAVGAASRSSQ